MNKPYIEFLKYKISEYEKEGNKEEMEHYKLLLEEELNSNKPIKNRMKNNVDKKNIKDKKATINKTIDEQHKISDKREEFIKELKKQTPEKNAEKQLKKQTPRKKAKEQSKKRKLTLKKCVAYGLLTGSIAAVPAYFLGYNYASNLPKSNNYRTVKEARLGLEHDSTNYIKYLKEELHLTDEEIEERMKKEEEEERWDR